jgi:hypothetical protein
MEGDSIADCGDVTVPLTVTIWTTARRSDWEISTGDAANADGSRTAKRKRGIGKVRIARFMVRRSFTPRATKRN